MGKRYLIDSNTIIDFCNGKLPLKGKDFLMNIRPEISIITQIELFANPNIPKQEYQLLEKFVDIAIVHAVDARLVQTTIDIRQNYKIKLPDAIIAATAIAHNLVLITRNIDDFKRLSNLTIVNPWALKP
jgi:predicted nucleic acid-binding protein